MVEKFDRLAKYSLDPDNQKMYAARKEQWEQSILFKSKPHIFHDIKLVTYQSFLKELFLLYNL